MNKQLAAAVVGLSLFLNMPNCQSQTVHSHHVANGSFPCIAAGDNNHLYASFEVYANGDQESDIFYTDSTDGGATWSLPINISKTLGHSTHSDIVVEKSGAIDIIWADPGTDPKSPDVFFARSSDGGKSWTKSLNISNTPGESAEPALAIGPDDSIHAVWTDTSKGEKNKDIYYARSTDGGKKWSQDALLPAVDISNTAGTASQPTIAVDLQGNVHVAWTDTRSAESHPDIYYSRKENDSWAKPINVCNSARISSHPAICCDKEKVFLTWTDNSEKQNAADVWLSISSGNGKFTKPMNISDTPGISTESVAAAADGQLVLAWVDKSTGSKDSAIYVKASFDQTNDFYPAIYCSHNNGIAKHPHLTLSGGKMLVIWEDVLDSENSIELGVLDLKALSTGTTPLSTDKVTDSMR